MVGSIGLSSQGHVTSVTIEQPDEARVGAKGAHGGQLRGLIIAPEATSAAESRQAGGGREAGAAEGEDTFARAEDLMEGLDVVVRRHGAGAISALRGS